jgi:DNA-binding response OmpR family regulator
MHIGLLEDDLAIQEMLCLVLQSEGYGVVIYSTAEECLTDLLAAERGPSATSPDLLIVDLRLPRSVSGTEVIAQLRADLHWRSLPIILTTASSYTNTGELEQLQVTLVTKPFDIDEMVRIIRELTQPQLPTQR